MAVIGSVIHAVLWSFIALLVVRFIVDWVQVFARSWTPAGPVLVGLEVVYTITDPPIKLFRSFIPPLRLGGIALDLSFLLVMVVCYLLLGLTEAIFLGAAS